MIFIIVIHFIDIINFTGCLLVRMADLLQQRDWAILNPDKWAIDAALDRHKLQASFTLVNSIKKSVDTQIQHLLTYIITCVDRNSNLNLLCVDDVCLNKLWLSLFSNTIFLPFDYNAIATNSVPTVDLKRSYCCQFPFSWEVIDQIAAAFGHRVGEGNMTVIMFVIIMPIYRRHKKKFCGVSGNS